MGSRAASARRRARAAGGRPQFWRPGAGGGANGSAHGLARASYLRSDGVAMMPSTANVEQGPFSERVTAVEPGALGSPGAAAGSAGEFDGEPEAFGRFTALRVLGSGAMGTVYSAYDERLDRLVAIKVAHGDSRGRAERALRLGREAQALARLSHPNIVQLYESGDCPTGLFLVLEYLPGSSLRAWVGAAPRSWREVLDAFVAAGRGLAAVHAQGMVHRDFKADNVIVGPDGRIRLVDFGLACSGHGVRGGKPRDEGGARGAEGRAFDVRVTAAGATLGTPAYMSPEQYQGQDVDGRADQFSFCAALYEALYRQRPFAGATVLAIEDEVSAGRLQPPPRDSAVPAWIHRALVRGLQPRREDRWPSMEALLAALSAAPPRPRRRWRAPVAVALGVLGALLTARATLAAGAGSAGSPQPVCAARLAVH